MFTEKKYIDNYSKKNILIILAIILFSKVTIYSQSISNYTFSASSGTYTALTGSTFPTLSAADDGYVNSISIGFDFWYMGTKYSTIGISSNGWISFGTITSSTTTNALASGGQRPILAPLWDDIDAVTTSSNVSYKLAGSAPNRTFTIEYNDMQWNYSAAGAVIDFQIILYETTGVIQFVYNQEATAYNSGSSGASIGITATATGSGNYISLNGTGASPAASTSSETTNLATKPANGQTYTFTPPTVGAAPTSLSFSGVSNYAMTLNWTASSPTTNILKYAIYSSTDDVTYTYQNTVNIGTNTYSASSLGAGVTYYWKVYAVSEGNVSSALSGSQATTSLTSSGSGNWNTAGTWSSGVVPSSADNVTIADGHTITIDASASCNNLTVGQGTSGILQFEQTTARTLTVTSNVTISNGGTFRSNSAGTQTGHVLSLGGNLTNNGTLDFSTNSNTAAAGITFTGSSNASFSGSGGTTDVKTITINKGTTYTPVLELSTSNFTVQGVNTDVAAFLTLTNGTFKISGSFTMSNRVISGASYTIGATTGLYLNNSNFTISAQAGTCTLNGLLQIDAGSMYVGSNASGQNLTSGAATAVFSMTGGNLYVYSRFYCSNAIVFTQSGGTITVVTGANSGNYSFYISSASTFNMSGGFIILRLPASGGNYDYINFAGTRTITGGTVQYGDASSGAAKTFTVSSGYFPNVVVTSTSGNHTAQFSQISGVDPYIYLDVTVQNGATFDGGTTWYPTMTFCGNVTIGTGSSFSSANPHTFKGNFANNGTYTANGGTVTFNGTGTQTISGSSTTSFYNFTTGNAATIAFSVPTTISNNLTLGGTSIVDANAALNIDGSVTIAAGTTFQEGANTHTIAGSWTDNGTFTEEGGTINFDGSSSQTISGSSLNFNNFTHSGSGTATLGAAVDINGNVSLTSGVFAQSSYNISVAGNWTSSGNYFTEGTGTVTFDGSSNSTITGSSAILLGTTGVSLMSQSFENGGAIPSGWGTTIVTDAGTDPALTYVGSITSPTISSPAAGSYFVKFNSFTSSSGGQIRLKQTSSFSTTGYYNIAVAFSWSEDKNGTYTDTGEGVEVQWSTDGSNWTSAGSLYPRYVASAASTTNGTWVSKSLTLPAGAENQATLYIAFLFTSKYGYNCALDNVVVTGDQGSTIVGEVFSKYAINKTGGGYVQMSSDMAASSIFTLTSGLVKTGAYTLILGTSASNVSISGGSSSAYVVAYDNAGTIGYIKQYVNSNTSYSFPMGDNTNYTPMTFTLNSNGGLSSAYLTTYTKAAKISNMNSSISTYITRYWDLTQSGMTSPNYNISYTYVDGDITGTEANLLPIKKSGATWYKPTGSSFTDGTAQGTGSVNTGTNTLTWNTLTTFSMFGGGGDQGVALPVELYNFDVKNYQGNVKLNWKTSSEINNDHFEVERSDDGENFEFVNQVKGAGNSNYPISYFMIDENYYKGINYYRLIMVDFNGSITVSPILSVDMSKKSDGVIIMTVNSIGQEVNETFKGVVFDIYSDGSSKKRIQ